MEELRHNKIDDLDRRCSTDTTILLKALSLFLPSDRQPELLLLIKFMEMQQLMKWFRKPREHCKPMGFDDCEQVFAAIRPSLSEPTAQKIEQLINMASMFRMYQQMKDLMEVLGPLSADSVFPNCSAPADGGPDADACRPKEDSGESGVRSGGMNGGMMEMLKNMIPPENQAMVEMLMQMNS